MLMRAGTVDFAGSSGTLLLDNSADFAGTVAGLFAQDMLDLRDISFAGVQTPNFSGDASGGTLHVSDGVHTAAISLLGNYLGSTFVASDDGHGGSGVVLLTLNRAT